MHGKALGINREPHRIVDQYERDEQHQDDEDAQHSGNPAEIRVQCIHERALIDHFIHNRGFSDHGFHDFEAVLGNVCSIQRNTDGHRDR